MTKVILLLILVSISVLMLFGTVNAANISVDANSSFNQSMISESSLSNSTNSSNVHLNESSALKEEYNSTKYRKNEILIRFKSNSGNATFEEISKKAHLQTGAIVIKDFKEVKSLQLVKIAENMPLQDAISVYLKNPDVLYAEPNYLCHNDAIPNDSYYNYQWGLSKINAASAWDITTGSSNVIIAVIDSGVDILHPDLKATIWKNPGEIPGNGIDDDGNGFIDDVYGWNFLDDDDNVSDNNGHGTHVAGIITACGNNTEGVAGVVWNAKIMSIKFLNKEGYGYIEDAVSAISYATKMGAHIINNSWEGSEYSKALKDIIDASSALVVCAAGNYVANNDLKPPYPASFTSPNIIAVAATDQNDNLAYFSNYGVNAVDVAAPGTSIYSTLPGSNYGYLSGTSMATPYVSGLAGLIKSLRPDLNNLQIKYTILNNVDFVSSLTGKVLTSGRINAFKSLTNIITDSTAPTASTDLKGGSYYSPLSVSLTASEPGDIYYTLDGTTPTVNSQIYRSSITIHSTQTIKFIARDTSGTLSGVYTETYLIYKLATYSYKVSVPYKRSKKKYKVWYRVSYKYKGKWRYKWYKWRYKWKYGKWRYKWRYKWYYRSVTRYGQKYVLT